MPGTRGSFGRAACTGSPSDTPGSTWSRTRRSDRSLAPPSPHVARHTRRQTMQTEVRSPVAAHFWQVVLLLNWLRLDETTKHILYNYLHLGGMPFINIPMQSCPGFTSS